MEPIEIHKSIRNGWRAENPHLIPGLEILGNYMQWLLKQVMKDLSVDLNANYGFASWLNAHDDGGFNTVHHHGIAALSGVLYLSCPEGSGSLFLRDPRPGAYFGNQLIKCGKDFCVKPREGHAVIFPGFLEHWVSPSSTAERISVAFNLTA